MRAKRNARMRKQMLAAAVLLGACLLLAGCATREEVAKKILKERYGEEFVVHKTWSSGGSYATCSPKNNRDVVFEVSFSKDDGKIRNDRYVNAVVSLRISKKLEEELQEYFPGCYVHSNGNYGDRDRYLSFSDIQSVTPKMYTERYPEESFTVSVYVEKEKLRQDTIGEEYQYFSETLLEEMEEGLLPDITAHFYYVDAEQQSQIRQYFLTHDWENGNGEYNDIIRGAYDWGFAYSDYGRPNGKINKTYEEYEELRRGGN